MVVATLIYASKVFVRHETLDREAILEIKVWELPNSKKFPDGIKYSMFCVDLETKEVLVGIDNHHPKGHHIHFGEFEEFYFFEGVEKLIDDFYMFARMRGYSV